jgi:hypothetical protein
MVSKIKLIDFSKASTERLLFLKIVEFAIIDEPSTWIILLLLLLKAYPNWRRGIWWWSRTKGGD